MKETTTTIVTTEVTRRAPRKKSIAKADHIVSDGKIYVAEHHIPAEWPGEGHGITRIGLSDAKKALHKGFTNIIDTLEQEDNFCLSTALRNLALIRNGLCDMITHQESSMIDKDDSERLQIIAVQLNEFIPILRGIMTRRVSQFALIQYPTI